MALLEEYELRTAWKYEPIRGTFHTAQGLENKIKPDGSYAPFYGSTVVFRSGRQELQMINMMQRLLHHKLESSGMLVSPLPVSTIHMTLHDLISPEFCTTDSGNQEEYHIEVAKSVKHAEVKVAEIRKEYAGLKITMVADRIVNMVSKSLVLLLKPQTEEDYKMLLEMYGRFDEVKRLPYPLTPHITLAYFKPGMIDGERLGEAVEFAQIHPDHAPVFEFYTEGITVQKFSDMKTYRDIPERICFCCDGGLNRSVMAANILNHMASEKNLPICGEARASYPNTQGWEIPQKTWEVLENNKVNPDKSHLTARYLEEYELSHFTAFAPISYGAMNLLSRLGIPEERKWEDLLGVKDPAYEGISHEEAFKELYEKIEKLFEKIKIDM